MSDNFEFKSLSEVEAMEKASDATTVLALDGGQVKQIPANQFGGGGGNLIVAGTLTDSGVENVDKTFAELKDAILNGVFPVLLVDLYEGDGMSITLVAQVIAFNPSEGIVFLINYLGTILQVICMPDDTWMVQPMGG